MFGGGGKIRNGGGGGGGARINGCLTTQHNKQCK